MDVYGEIMINRPMTIVVSVHGRDITAV